MSADKYPCIFSRQMKTIVYLLDEVFVISRIIKVEVGVISRSRFCFFTDGEQHKARELDMITLRDHAPRSYMT